ncbi:MAG: hypothetical protein IKX96_01605 [Firmicutes bacterium]|nr:hypothetical protein [Bacillota bacterium]
MKQFMVLCAVLPIMLLLMIQFSLDEINAYKIQGINQLVYAKSEEAKQNGCFTSEMEDELKDQIAQLGFAPEDIDVDFELDSEISYDAEAGHEDGYVRRGYPIYYYVSVRFNRPMAAALLPDNYYYYTISSYTASEY